MNANQMPVIWTVIICTALLAIAGFLAIGYVADTVKESVPEIPDFPSEEAIAAQVLASVDIPTAAEIAALIDVPDTHLSVRDYKKQLAEELATDELSDRDVREEITDALNDCHDTDVERKDITSVIVKDVDVDGAFGTTARVLLEVKVYFDNYGDEAESARVEIEFVVKDLDRDDDYEDAEVTDFEVGNVYSCSTE